jgi:arylformamidase
VSHFIDLSHTIEHGMTTYKGIPGPLICDFLSREASRGNYAAGTEFHIGRIDMVANTGTYLDSPFHRYAHGKDLSQLQLPQLAHLPGVVIRAPFERTLAVDTEAFAVFDVAAKAVLVHTGWDRHWRRESYFEDHPFLTEAAAEYLVRNGAILVGIDSHNIDDTRRRTRPVHSILLGNDIPICEHLCNLAALPEHGFNFYAVPPKVTNFGTFPVRAFACVDTRPA